MRRIAEAGHALPLVALALATLMGFGGIAADVGYWRYQERQQQSATDAAALGGAQQLLYSSCPNAAVALAAAQADAANNGYVNGTNGTSVTAQNPPTGAFSSNACAVMVQIGKSNVPVFFTRLFGQSFMAETTQAVATVTANNNGCIYMLGNNQNTNFNGGTVQAPGCSIYVNGSANFNGATVNAKSIGEGNYSGSNNGGNFSGASPAKIYPIADPCREIPGCASLTSNPPSTSPCNGTFSNGGTLSPGCYSNLNAHGGTLTLANGTYTFLGSTNLNGATVNGTNATIYIPSGSSVNGNGSTWNLSAPTTGAYANVAIYQAPGDSNDINLNGGTIQISGLIYAPSAHINYNGSGSAYTVIVAAYANFNGSMSQSWTTPPPGNTIIRSTVLAQ